MYHKNDGNNVFIATFFSHIGKTKTARKGFHSQQSYLENTQEDT